MEMTLWTFLSIYLEMHLSIPLLIYVVISFNTFRQFLWKFLRQFICYSFKILLRNFKRKFSAESLGNFFDYYIGNFFNTSLTIQEIPSAISLAFHWIFLWKFGNDIGTAMGIHDNGIRNAIGHSFSNPFENGILKFPSDFFRQLVYQPFR